MKQYKDIDEIYKNIPLKDLAWVYDTPPQELVDLVKSEKIKPCKTVDLGCGTGTNAIYFANQGFDVTGIDISPTAIKFAKENALKKKANCKFEVADLLGNLKDFTKKFDFAYDWELLHHIFPENRKKYLLNVRDILKPKGVYLSVSFSEKDPCFGGKEKYRKTPIGTVLYFSSQTELRSIFEPYFKILEIKTTKIRGKPASHITNYIIAEVK